LRKGDWRIDGKGGVRSRGADEEDKSLLLVAKIPKANDSIATTPYLTTEQDEIKVTVNRQGRRERYVQEILAALELASRTCSTQWRNPQYKSTLRQIHCDRQY